MLDRYCQKVKIVPISESTIGKVIKRKHFFFFYQRSGRACHNPALDWAKRKKVKKLRVRYAPKPKEFGYLQLDTICKFTDGLKRCLYSAIDH